MNTLFYPKNIVIIGASRDKKKVGSMILHNILTSNYQGEIFLVNPTAKSIQGMPVLSTVSSLPLGIDVAIVVIPSVAVLSVVQELAHKQVKNCIIISAGFGEVNKTGKSRERELVRIAKQSGMRILGPNCLGLINNDPHTLSYNGSFGLPVKHIGGTSLISQSGALISALTDIFDQYTIGFNKIISLGNKSDLTEKELIPYLISDPTTQVVACYLESLVGVREYIPLIRKTKKPVIILKAGKSSIAQKTIQSHTGSIAGEYEVMETLLKEAGVIVVSSIEEFRELIYLFSYHTAVSAHPAAIITNAGGVGVLTIDAAYTQKLPLASLDDRIISDLHKNLPSSVSLHNPIDLLGDADGFRYRYTLQKVLSQKTIGSTIIIVTPQILTPLAEIGHIITESQKEFPHKPHVVIAMGGTQITQLKRHMKEIPIYETVDSAVRSLATLYSFSNTIPNAKLWDTPTAYIKKSALEQLFPRLQHNAQDGLLVQEAELQQLANIFDLPLPKSHIVNTSSDIEKIAKKIRFPLVMKNIDPNLLHRTENHAVQIGIQSVTQMKKFYMLHKGSIVLVQEQLQGGVEVFLGVKYDPEFGCILILGTGGIYAEIMNDFAMATMPITKTYITKTLKKTKIYEILRGARGKKYDLKALIDVIYQVNLMVYHIPLIREIDMNPIMVFEKGCVILDAKIQIKSI